MLTKGALCDQKYSKKTTNIHNIGLFKGLFPFLLWSVFFTSLFTVTLIYLNIIFHYTFILVKIFSIKDIFN